MQIKDLFTVPEGEKVTEKRMRCVLISSICSILLCMTCLLSTTWAWFAVTIENSGNVIQITKPDVTATVETVEAVETVENAPVTSGCSLKAGEYKVNFIRTVNKDDLQEIMECIVILTIQRENGKSDISWIAVSESASVTIKTDQECKIFWEASWFVPQNATQINGGEVVVTADEVADLSSESTGEPSEEQSAESPAEPSEETSTESNTPNAIEAETDSMDSADLSDTEATEESTIEESTTEESIIE